MRVREILFRGKRKDNGECVEGGILQDEGYVAILVYSDYHGWHDFIEVIPESVSEFTGLTDKNGKKMFEGDIVAGAAHWLERYKNGVVAFRDGSFGLIWYRGNIEQFNPFTSMCNVEYEVIDNIHDNPELLKGGEG